MKKILAIILTLFIVPEVLALDMEYYAPNGLPTVAEAFQRMALIFSDGDYFSAYGIFVMVGMFLAIANNYVVKPSSGGASSNYSWITPAIIGTILVFGLVLPKGTIHIYDPVKNNTISVPGIPDGVVLIAGLFNLLERKMIDITDTASAYPYSKNADGINFTMFLNAIQEGKNNKKYFLQKDVKEYYSKCGRLSMAITGTNFEDFRSGITSPYAVLSEWIHPSVWVNMYNGNRTLNNMTCTEAWNNVLKDALAATNFTEEVESACTTGGFDVTNTAQRQRCFEIIGQANQFFDVTSTSATNLIREAFINETILKKINEDEPEAAQRSLLGRQITLQGLGSLNAAQDTQVNNKAVMTAIILGLIPLLSLFFVTPLWLKALKFIAGAMLWLTTWGITMAVAHAGVMDAAIAVTDELVRHKMGLDAFMFAETDAIKALMLFGKMQSNSIMMATAVAIGVYGFGSYAMAGLAQGMAQGMQNTGERVSSQTITSEGRSSMRRGLSTSLADAGTVQGSSGPSESMGTGGGWNSYAGMSSMDAYNAGINQNTGENLRHSESGVGGQSMQTADAKAGEITGANAGRKLVAESNDVSNLQQSHTTAKTQTIGAQTSADSAKITQENLGKGDQVKGADKIAESNQGQFQGKVQKAQYIAEMTGQDGNNPDVIRSIGQNMALNNGAYAMSGESIKNSGVWDKLSNPQQNALDSKTNYSITTTFDKDGNLNDSIGVTAGVNVREDNSAVKNKDNIDSSINRVDAHTDFGAATLGTAISNINNPTTSHGQATAIKGFNNLVDHSVRGEGDFNEQERRTLENATTGWWKSNGVDFKENKIDASTKSTTESASIDSGKAVWGKAFSLMFGATGSIGMNAVQQTRDEENMSFDSLNEVSSKFIDVANGDSQKYADLVSNFDEHVRELREKNTSSNTGVTSNINNDADDILDQEKEEGNGKKLTRRGYR